jgi:hypothetical protein
MKSYTLKEFMDEQNLDIVKVMEATGFSRTTIREIYNENYPVSNKIRNKFKEVYEIDLIDKVYKKDQGDKTTEGLIMENSEIDKQIERLKKQKEENEFKIKINFIADNSKKLYEDKAFVQAVERLYDYVIEKTGQSQKKVESKTSNKMQKSVEEILDTPKKEETNPIVEKSRKRPSKTVKEIQDADTKEDDVKVDTSPNPSVSIESEEIHAMPENKKEKNDSFGSTSSKPNPDIKTFNNLSVDDKNLHHVIKTTPTGIQPADAYLSCYAGIIDEDANPLDVIVPPREEEDVVDENDIFD